jgi:hypothetical protein
MNPRGPRRRKGKLLSSGALSSADYSGAIKRDSDGRAQSGEDPSYSITAEMPTRAARQVTPKVA